MNIYRKEDNGVCVIEITSENKAIADRYKNSSGNVEFLIDQEDFKRVCMFTWGINTSREVPYAASTMTGYKVKEPVYLHHLITSFEHNIVDHVNGSPLDNRKVNLRGATYSQNAMNMCTRKSRTNKYKGVTRRNEPQRKPFRARITVDGKLMALGSFSSAEDAALAYNVAAKKYFGEYARINLISSTT